MTTKRWLITALMVALATSFSGCEEQGPAEKAGKDIDRAMEKTEENVKDALDKDGAAEKAGEKLDKATE